MGIYLYFFFNFRKNIWLEKLNRCDLINETVATDWRVCEKHFTGDMYRINKLLPNAVPIQIIPERAVSKATVLEDIVIVPPKNVTDNLHNESCPSQDALKNTSISDENILCDSMESFKGKKNEKIN